MQPARNSVADMLVQIIDNAKLWRESWGNLVSSQLQIVTEYEGLYDPIVGATDGLGRQAAATPQLQLERTFKLKTAYGDLTTELLGEMAMIEDHILKPAADARDCIAPIRKTIKKRENKRVDYEKLQEKAIKLHRKPGRTPKEDIALAKAETEVSRAAEVRINAPTPTIEFDLETNNKSRSSRSLTNISAKPFPPSSPRRSALSLRYSTISS